MKEGGREKFPDVVDAVRAGVTRVPGHGRFVAERIRELAKLPGTGRDRAHLFNAYLRPYESEETIEELCSFLDDWDKIPEEFNDGTFTAANARLAVQALSKMRLPGSPTGIYARGHPHEAEKWKRWHEKWRAARDGAAPAAAVPSEVPHPETGTQELETVQSDPDDGSHAYWWLAICSAMAAFAIWLVKRALATD